MTKALGKVVVMAGLFAWIRAEKGKGSRCSGKEQELENGEED